MPSTMDENEATPIDFRVKLQKIRSKEESSSFRRGGEVWQREIGLNNKE